MLVGSDPSTNFVVLSSTDREGCRVTGTGSSTNPPTSPFGVASQLPARGAGGVGVNHVQVDNTSPSSCPSTGVWSTNECYILLYLLQLVCEIVLQISMKFYILLCVHALHILSIICWWSEAVVFVSVSYYLLVVRGSCVCECVQFGVGGCEGGLEVE